jgi:hypothetical protein
MNRKLTGIVSMAAILASILPWQVARSQGSLDSQLATKYKVAKTGEDSTGVSVTEPGTVLVVKKGGILSFPTASAHPLSTTYKDGSLHGPNSFVMKALKQDTKFLTVGEKVYATKIEVNQKDSKVAVSIIECDTCNSVQDPSSRRAQVVFQFPKGYLDNADGGQVSDLIAQVLAEDAAGDDAQAQQQGQDSQSAQQQGGQQDAQQNQAPAGPPPTVKLGQSPDDVVAAFGQPKKIIDLGAKQIYVYADMKVTFVKGKVSDVQ